MNDFDHVAWNWLVEWSLMIAWVGSECLPDGDAWCGWVMNGPFVEADRWNGEFELISVICFGSLFCDVFTPCWEGSWCGRVVGWFTHWVYSGWCCCHCRFQFLVEAKRDLKKFFCDFGAWWLGTKECDACDAVTNVLLTLCLSSVDAKLQIRDYSLINAVTNDVGTNKIKNCERCAKSWSSCKALVRILSRAQEGAMDRMPEGLV